MSENEGNQNNQLSDRDIEEEEMAQELMNMEMYEVGMQYDQMKEILRFINESKNMAGIESENRLSHEVSQYSDDTPAAEISSKNNSQREIILKENSVPKPSYSYRLQSGTSSPASSNHISTREIAPVEEMPVLSPEIFDNEEPKLSGTDDESIFDKLVKANDVTEKDEINESRSQILGKNRWYMKLDSPQNSPNSENSETSSEDIKSKKNQRIERWRLDPTNAVVDDNEVLLREGNRPILNEKIPYRFCHNRRVFEPSIRDKVLTVLTHTLEEVPDMWRRNHRPDVSEFQWGSPIKVGVINNRSLDKKPVLEEVNSSKRCDITRNNSASVHQKNMRRNCKRKAVDTIRNRMQDDIESDERNNDIFEKVKKSKASDTCWQPSSRLNTRDAEKGLTRKDRILNNIPNLIKVQEPLMIEGCESDEFDNDDLHSLCLKNKQKNEQMNRTPSPHVFPRRIIPPNPGKPKTLRRPAKYGEKGKRKSPIKKDTQAVLEGNKNSGLSTAKGRSRNLLAKQTVILNDNEISNKLGSDEHEENYMEIEIKPMPVKGLASKLHKGTSLLLETKKAEERIEQVKIQVRLKVEMEEKMMREDIQKARFLKEREERTEREAKELAIKAKEQAWKKSEAARVRDLRRRQAEEKKRSEEARRDDLFIDDDDNVDTIIDKIDAKQRSLAERVQCPICLLEFSKAEIQDHAADCDQFDNLNEPSNSVSSINDNELTIINDTMIFDCNICSRFTTTDGIIYEQHVNDCMKRRKRDALTQNMLDIPAKEVVEVPMSPIRCFVPISEQTESAIDYGEQFPERKFKPKTSRTKRRG